MKRLLVRWLMPEIRRELLRTEMRIITPIGTTNAKNIKINYTTQEAP